MTISQVELDQQEDRAFLKMVLIIFALGIIATVITLKVLHLTFPAISLGQAHKVPLPTSGTSTAATVNSSHPVSGTSASPRATNSKGLVSPSSTVNPSIPRPTQTNGQQPTTVPSVVPIPTSIPSLSLPSLVPLPSITLPVPLPSVSLGLHLG